MFAQIDTFQERPLLQKSSIIWEKVLFETTFLCQNDRPCFEMIFELVRQIVQIARQPKWDFWHHFGEPCSQLKSEKWQFRIKPHYCPLLGQKSMFMKKHFPIPQKSCIALGTFIFSLLCFSGSFSYILFFNLGIIFWHINLVNFDIDILMAILLLFISYVKWFKKFLVLEKHDFLMFKKTYNSITYSKLPLSISFKTTFFCCFSAIPQDL